MHEALDFLHRNSITMIIRPAHGPYPAWTIELSKGGHRVATRYTPDQFASWTADIIMKMANMLLKVMKED